MKLTDLETKEMKERTKKQLGKKKSRKTRMNMSRSTVGRNHKITWLMELGGAAVARYPRAYEFSKKAACWHEVHKPWLSLESLLLEHQASQTKFSKIPNKDGQ